MRAAGSSGTGSFRNGLSSPNGGDAICFIVCSICLIWSRDEGLQRSRERSSAPPSLRFSLQTLFTSIHSGKLIMPRNEKAANIDWIGWKQQQYWSAGFAQTIICSKVAGVFTCDSSVQLTGTRAMKLESAFNFTSAPSKKKQWLKF